MVIVPRLDCAQKLEATDEGELAAVQVLKVARCCTKSRRNGTSYGRGRWL